MEAWEVIEACLWGGKTELQRHTLLGRELILSGAEKGLVPENLGLIFGPNRIVDSFWLGY
jgi:hypothetical protein